MTKEEIDKGLDKAVIDVKNNLFYMHNFEEKIMQHPRLLIELTDFCLDSYVEEKRKDKKLYCPYCKEVYDWDDWQWDSELKCKRGHVLPINTSISCNDDYVVGFDNEEKPVLMAKFSFDKSNEEWAEEEKQKMRELVSEKEKMEKDLKAIDEVVKKKGIIDRQIEAGWHI